LDALTGIPFLQNVVGVELYQLRAVIRAGTGDLVAATCPPIEAYQRYNRDRLNLGDPELLFAPATRTTAEVGAACMSGEAFARLTEASRESGGLLIHPYMGVEVVWELAEALAESAGVPVRVLGPPPPVTWLSNDKYWLTEVARFAAGEDAIVETLYGKNVETLAEHLKTLSERHEQVALKKTRCASAMGNRLWRSCDIKRMDHGALCREVEGFLSDKAWVQGELVLAVAWETCSSSPSTQMWIPPVGGGEPKMDGFYEQLLVGPEQVFLGSIPSGLSAELESRMGWISMQIAHVYQALGYVGRCSFDFVVTAKGDVRIVECNGRWGGTSTPMHLMDRIFSEGRPSYRARDVIDSALVGMSFEALEALLGDKLYDSRTGRGHFLLYNMGMLETYGKFDVIAMGEDAAAATRALEEELPKLLGIG